jgi:hypothetical protein
MSFRKTFADHTELREVAMIILERCGYDRDIILAVQRLMNSPDDSLPREEAVRRLEALLGKCQPDYAPPGAASG